MTDILHFVYCFLCPRLYPPPFQNPVYAPEVYNLFWMNIFFTLFQLRLKYVGVLDCEIGILSCIHDLIELLLTTTILGGEGNKGTAPPTRGSLVAPPPVFLKGVDFSPGSFKMHYFATYFQYFGDQAPSLWSIYFITIKNTFIKPLFVL